MRSVESSLSSTNSNPQSSTSSLQKAPCSTSRRRSSRISLLRRGDKWWGGESERKNSFWNLTWRSQQSSNRSVRHISWQKILKAGPPLKNSVSKIVIKSLRHLTNCPQEQSWKRLLRRKRCIIWQTVRFKPPWTSQLALRQLNAKWTIRKITQVTKKTFKIPVLGAKRWTFLGTLLGPRVTRRAKEQWQTRSSNQNRRIKSSWKIWLQTRTYRWQDSSAFPMKSHRPQRSYQSRLLFSPLHSQAIIQAEPTHKIMRYPLQITWDLCLQRNLKKIRQAIMRASWFKCRKSLQVIVRINAGKVLCSCEVSTLHLSSRHRLISKFEARSSWMCLTLSTATRRRFKFARRSTNTCLRRVTLTKMT